MKTKIARVQTVELSLLKSNPPQLLIVATGYVPTLGWTQPELKPTSDTVLNGTFELDFIAQPPIGIVPQVITPITASYVLETIPKDLNAIKVNAATNSISRHLVEEKQEVNPQEEADSKLSFVPYLEILKGIEMTSDKLIITVPTGGCTDKKSFEITVNKGITGQPPYLVTITRILPDACDGHFPDGIKLEYDLAKLNIEPWAWFSLENQIGGK